MNRTRSISLRLAAMFGLATTLVSIVASVALFFLQTSEFNRHTQEELRGRLVIVERMVQHNTGGQRWARLEEKLADFTPTDGSVRFLIDSDDPNYRIGTDFLSGAAFTGQAEGFGTATVGDRYFSTLASDIPAKAERPPVRLLIAVDQRPQETSRAMLAYGILLISLLTIIAVSTLGWWIARRGLAPVDRLSDHAQDLGEGDLALRLPIERLPTELEGLVLSLNAALERLQRSHQKLSDFNADVAHELRTPLTNLIGETQVALTRDRDTGDLTTVLQSNLEELERMRAIINDMLFLARADAGDIAGNLLLVDIAEECKRTIEFMDVLFEEAGTEVVIEGSAQGRIEPSLIGRALSNLLNNALRHGNPGAKVIVRIEDKQESVTVSVVNSGKPIAPDALSRIFDRFYCADPSRQSDGRSHGLGLAIVKAVARMHGGTVHAFNREGTVSVGFELPKQTTAAGTHAPQARKVVWENLNVQTRANIA